MKTISFFILTLLFCLVQNHQVYAAKSAVIGEKDTTIVLMETSCQRLVAKGFICTADNLQGLKIAKMDTSCPYWFLVPKQRTTFCAMIDMPDFSSGANAMDQQDRSGMLKENNLSVPERKKG